MRSRASGVARLEAVATEFILNPDLLCVLFMFHGRATQERVPCLLQRAAPDLDLSPQPPATPLTAAPPTPCVA
jgi:hypothetical protein